MPPVQVMLKHPEEEQLQEGQEVMHLLDEASLNQVEI